MSSPSYTSQKYLKHKNEENFLKHRKKCKFSPKKLFLFFNCSIQNFNKRKRTNNKNRNSNKNENYKRVKSTSYIEAQLLLHNIIAVTSRTNSEVE